MQHRNCKKKESHTCVQASRPDVPAHPAKYQPSQWVAYPRGEVACSGSLWSAAPLVSSHFFTSTPPSSLCIFCLINAEVCLPRPHTNSPWLSECHALFTCNCRHKKTKWFKSNTQPSTTCNHFTAFINFCSSWCITHFVQQSPMFNNIKHLNILPSKPQNIKLDKFVTLELSLTQINSKRTKRSKLGIYLHQENCVHIVSALAACMSVICFGHPCFGRSKLSDFQLVQPPQITKKVHPILSARRVSSTEW